MSGGREQVIDQIAWAYGVVDAAEVPDDLRVAAFQYALHLSGDVLHANGSIRALPILRTPSAEPAHDIDMLSRLAAELRLPRVVVEQIYRQTSGVIRLAAVRSLLPEPDNKAASMRHVALLVAVGRQLAGQEQATPFSAMRRECQELGVLDGPNFATEVRKLNMSIEGGHNTKLARTHGYHHQQAVALIQRMARARGETQ